MIIQTTKDVNIEHLLSELNIKSKKKGIDGKNYCIEVNRQLLADAYDTLKYYYDKYGDNLVEDDGK